MKFKLQPQEREGNYHFNGLFLATASIIERLPLEEITAIQNAILREVNTKDGLDYLQVFIHEETGDRLFFIDQLNKEMIADGGFEDDDNHCTLMFAHEY